MYQYEMHLHSKEGSKCGKNSAREMVRAYQQAGYTGFVLTDHFIHGNTAVPKDLAWDVRMQMYYDAYLEAKDEGEKLDFDVLFGIEHAYGQGKEILVYGVGIEFLKSHPELEEADIDTFARLMHEAGGILVHAHPYRQRAYITKGVSPRVDLCHGVEVYNSHEEWETNKKALQDAVGQEKYCFSGGDTHRTEDERIGHAGLIFGKRIRTSEELLQALAQKDYQVLMEGQAYSMEELQELL